MGKSLRCRSERFDFCLGCRSEVSRKWATWGGCRYPQHGLSIWNKDRIAGVFLTHGHADAIGALPYLLAEAKVPVFGTELTIELAKLFVKSNDSVKKFNDFHVIDQNSEIDFGDAVVSFFQTTHSIPESIGIVIGTPEGNIVYTGDFKFDQTPASHMRQTLLV